MSSVQHATRCMNGNDIKVNINNSDIYRKLVRHFQDNNVIFHTYEINQERAYSVVTHHPDKLHNRGTRFP